MLYCRGKPGHFQRPNRARRSDERVGGLSPLARRRRTVNPRQVGRRLGQKQRQHLALEGGIAAGLAAQMGKIEGLGVSHWIG